MNYERMEYVSATFFAPPSLITWLGSSVNFEFPSWRERADSDKVRRWVLGAAAILAHRVAAMEVRAYIEHFIFEIACD